MKSDEVRALGRLGARTFAGAVTHVERVHGAIATRAFRPASFVGAPARYTHDALAKVVYACVRGAGRGVGLAAAEVGALVPRTEKRRRRGPSSRSRSSTPPSATSSRPTTTRWRYPCLPASMVSPPRRSPSSSTGWRRPTTHGA